MHKLERSQLKSFLNRVSSSLEGAEAEVELAVLDVGDQIEQRWNSLTGVSYDAKSDSITISTTGQTRQVKNPMDVHVRWRAGCLEQLAFADPEEHRYMVKFHPPLVLPAGEKIRRPT